MNKNVINKTIVAIICSSVFLSSSYAAEIKGKLMSFSVADEVVTFKTDSTTSYTKASCAISENTHTISLKHATGRAMYAALVAASSANKPVTSVLSGECLDATGVESITALTISELNEAANSTPSQSSTPSLKLVGRGVHYYSNGYRCIVGVTAKNQSGQPYLYQRGGGGCGCRNSITSGIPLVEPTRNSNGGLAGTGTEFSCYIEE